MSKYLFRVSVTEEGLQGLMKEGAASRKETVGKLIAGLGGKLEAYYFAFGETDTYVIADLPDNEAAAAASLVVAASGAAAIETTVLLTTDEIDRALQLNPNYRPPGA